MGSYHGASTIVDHTWFGRSDDELKVTAVALVGPRGFKDNAQFRDYCDLIDRVRAFAKNYEESASIPGAREQVQNVIINTMIEVGRIEMGKDPTLFAQIKTQLGWPLEFIQNTLMNHEPEAEPQMAMGM